MADEGERIHVEGNDCESVLEIDASNNDNNEIDKNFEDNEVVRKRNRNKKIECIVCFKSMQSNHLKRHTKQHPDLMLMDEEEARLELY